MAKSNSKRKTHSNRFQLTLHKTGLYCKKIKCKLYYFGTGRKTALRGYLEQAAFLHAGKPSKSKCNGDALSIKTLCNLYLDHQESRSMIGEIKLRHLYDQTSLLYDTIDFTAELLYLSVIQYFILAQATPKHWRQEMEIKDRIKTRIVLLGVMIVLFIVITMQVSAEDQRKDETKASAKMWQHLALTNTIGDTPKSELGRSINKLGREGWELVSVGNINESGTTTKTVFYFKKPL